MERELCCLCDAFKTGQRWNCFQLECSVQHLLSVLLHFSEDLLNYFKNLTIQNEEKILTYFILLFMLNIFFVKVIESYICWNSTIYFLELHFILTIYTTTNSLFPSSSVSLWLFKNSFSLNPPSMCPHLFKEPQ